MEEGLFCKVLVLLFVFFFWRQLKKKNLRQTFASPFIELVCSWWRRHDTGDVRDCQGPLHVQWSPCRPRSLSSFPILRERCWALVKLKAFFASLWEKKGLTLKNWVYSLKNVALLPCEGKSWLCQFLFYSWVAKQPFVTNLQLSLKWQHCTVDHLARGSMKNAANCVSECELQDIWASTLWTHIADTGSSSVHVWLRVGYNILPLLFSNGKSCEALGFFSPRFFFLRTGG